MADSLPQKEREVKRQRLALEQQMEGGDNITPQSLVPLEDCKCSNNMIEQLHAWRKHRMRGQMVKSFLLGFLSKFIAIEKAGNRAKFSHQKFFPL